MLWLQLYKKNFTNITFSVRFLDCGLTPVLRKQNYHVRAAIIQTNFINITFLVTLNFGLTPVPCMHNYHVMAAIISP